ncbi:MAG: DUF1552 domain-containing protein, partial [Bdellovibrionales bacterium]
IALPFLESLSPFKSLAGAQTPGVPKRFVAFVNRDGYYESVYFPSVAADIKVDDHTYYKMLTSISGPISETIGTEFDAFRSKMNFYRGLDIPGSVGHSTANALCAAAREVFGDYSPTDPIGNSRSIDVVLSKSKNFYPTTPAFSGLRGQENSYAFSMSFDKDTAGKTVKIPYTLESKIMFQQVFGDKIADAGVAAQVRANKITIGDLILEDYKNLLSHKRISAADKVTVDNFVTQVQELNKRINDTVALSCSAPTMRSAGNFYYDLRTETDHINEWSNFIDIMVSAMACDLTRICILSARIFGHDHGHSHNDHRNRENQLKYISNTRKLVRIVKEFVTKMDSVKDSNGKTMLDNSIFLWGMEQSEGAGHRCESMPAITFGSANGAINTGYYIDYRVRPLVHAFNRTDLPAVGSRTYASLLITIMRALGLQPSEYLSYGDGGGFGTYGSYYTDPKLYAPFKALRNDPLPVIFKG